MSQEVVQWLNEIKALKEQVAALQQALADSNASADKWRQLYETEAQQRRQESAAMQQQIEELQGTIVALQQAASPSQLQQERDRLTESLAAEKSLHEKSRKDLTTALSDAMELISKGKQRLPDVAQPNAVTPNAVTPNVMTPNVMTPNAVQSNVAQPDAANDDA
jgi:predicted  nucleic acid-binding Zn-ribbon protein